MLAGGGLAAWLWLGNAERGAANHFGDMWPVIRDFKSAEAIRVRVGEDPVYERLSKPVRLDAPDLAELHVILSDPSHHGRRVLSDCIPFPGVLFRLDNKVEIGICFSCDILVAGNVGLGPQEDATSMIPALGALAKKLFPKDPVILNIGVPGKETDDQI